MVLAFAAATATYASPSRAQCGANRSTCSACHDGARAAFAAEDPWHADHRFADVCAVCHGGLPDAAEAKAAHVGLLAPLAGETQCISCHGDASAALARRYARERETTAAATTPTDPGANDGPAGALVVLIGLLGLGWVAARERATLREWRGSWMRALDMASSNDERS